MYIQNCRLLNISVYFFKSTSDFKSFSFQICLSIFLSLLRSEKRSTLFYKNQINPFRKHQNVENILDDCFRCGHRFWLISIFVTSNQVFQVTENADFTL